MKAKVEQEKPESRDDQKWSKEVLALGWLKLPAVLLEGQRRLKFSATEVNVLLHILRHWWRPDEMPFPTKKTIAECMGVCEATVRRCIARMERLGYVQRVVVAGKANRFDLSGLVAALKPLARNIRQMRERHREEKAKFRAARRQAAEKLFEELTQAQKA